LKPRTISKLLQPRSAALRLTSDRPQGRLFNLSYYLIQNNRNGNRFDFAFAKSHKRYESHSAVVVETGEDPQGSYALTIGGNEGNSVGQKLARLKSNGLIKQRQNSAFIYVIQNLK
jgi:hypothetical protein